MTTRRRTTGLLATLALLGTLLTTFAAPARANIGPNAWDRSTIVIDYYRNVAGSTLSIVEGSCQVNMPCIRIYWDFYGNQTWDGLTTDAYTDCLTPAKWCRYDGTNSLVTHTTVQFDRTWVDGFTGTAFQSLACHELGRAIAELTAAAGQTCMNSGTYAYTGLLSTEAAQLRAKYTGLPR